MISMEFGPNANSKTYYKGKSSSRFYHLPSRTLRKYRQQPRWVKLLLLFAGLMLLFGYVPYFSFVKDLSTSVLPPTPSQQQPKTSTISHTDREHILLYRIIGNDLPPRHKEGQTLSNLQFILDHEPEFPNTRKIFLLNRISNAANEAAIVQLLNRHHKEYIRLPFEEHVYKQLDFRLEDFTEPDFLHSDDYRRYSKVAKLRVLDYTYHDKNLYAMNNNGGRNAAIEHARTIKNAKWIMPFDGNCYLSTNGFREIKAQLDYHGANTKYFTVPMSRLLNNSVLLDDLDERPKAPEEPQIIFRHDATEKYNLNMRYGRRSKLELLWTLGALENRRLSRPTVPWEPSERPFSPDKGNFRSIGWVFRLFSGNSRQEENKKEASSIRAFNRLLAIQSSLDSLDESIARRDYQQDKLFLFNDKAMASIRYDYWNKNDNDNDYITKAVQHLMAYTETIMDDDLISPTSIQQSSSFGSLRLGALSQNVTTLAMAHYFSGGGSNNSGKYGKMAAELIRMQLLANNTPATDDGNQLWSTRSISENNHFLDFLSDQGYSFPGLGRLSVTSTIKKHRASFSSSSSTEGSSGGGAISHRLLSLSDLTKTDTTFLLDSIRILRRMQLLTADEYTKLQSIAGEYLEYLVTSPAGIHLAQMTDHRGVLYDLQVTSLATFTNDVQLFLRVANRCRMRIGKQFSSDGDQPYQRLRLQSMMMMDFRQPMMNSTQQSATSTQKGLLHYESLNLQYWLSLMRGIQNTGVAKDIWYYTAKNGASISHAVTKHLQSYAQLTALWDDDDTRVWANSKLRPLLLMAYKAFQHATTMSSFTTMDHQQYQADRAWVEKAVSLELFGNGHTIDINAPSNNHHQHQSTSKNDMLEFILDDHAAGQPSIAPFWMLGNV